jgi:SAM-dependent methyltransferase
MTDQAFAIQLELPRELPLGVPFELRGWIGAREPIGAVGNGGGNQEWLDLHERPAIRDLHPEWPHLVGFRGRLGAAAIAQQSVLLRLKLGGKELVHAIARSPISPPPDHLQVRQVGSVWGERFYPAGREMFDQINQVFVGAGSSLTETHRVLDFGCGCARVMRSFGEISHRAEIWGCDIDGEAIAWNQANLAALGSFYTNPTEPPTSFADGFFDAIYSVSVFTHLPEDMQMAWVRELHRVMAPGGLLVPSFHGEHYWQQDPGVAAEVTQRGFAYRTGEITAGLPEFYMVAYHSIDYIREKWSPWFEVLAHHPRCIDGAHDAVVLRRRPD